MKNEGLKLSYTNSIPTDAEGKKRWETMLHWCKKMHREELDRFLASRNLKLITGMAADFEQLKKKKTAKVFLWEPGGPRN